MNPFELHPEDREKMKKKLNKNKIDITKVKKIIAEYQKEFKENKVPMWGYGEDHINKIFKNIILKIEKEASDDS